MQTSAPTASHGARPFFSHTVQTLGQIESVNADSGIAVEFRAADGIKPSILIEGGQSQSMSLWHTSSRTGFVTMPKFDVDVVTIRFVTKGAMVRRDHRHEHTGRCFQAMMVTFGAMMMVTFGAMRNEEFSTDFASISATVPRIALSNAHFALEGDETLLPIPDFLPVVDATSDAFRGLRSVMQQVLEQLKVGVQSADLIFPLLEEVMIYRILTIWPRKNGNSNLKNLDVSKRTLKRAVHYIDENIQSRITLHDISSSIGVGVRRIQGAFKREMGTTPVQYIIDSRLDRVRYDLQTSSHDISISVVAARWGFVHMGDFSRRYRERFGEAPSATRRRRR